MYETPINLCYSTEVVLPTKLKYSTIRSEICQNLVEVLAFEAELLERKQEKAYVYLTNYEQILRHYWNQSSNPILFNQET